MEFKYDVIVIGAGHAGCEAAAAAANLGSKTCLITMDMNKIGQMSCNPAVGGIAKGQIVREIDALGGYMGLVTDQTAIQFQYLSPCPDEFVAVALRARTPHSGTFGTVQYTELYGCLAGYRAGNPR